MSAEERAWAKAETSTTAMMLWAMRLSDLKQLLFLEGMSGTAVASRTAAVETLHAFYHPEAASAAGVDINEEHDPEDDELVESDTDSEQEEPKDPAEEATA
jgi:hypothetical protein